MKRSFLGLVFTAAIALPGTASGQATTWLYGGGGVSIPPARAIGADNSTTGRNPAGLLHVDVGLGVPADQPFVWGGLARLQVHGQSGVDLGFLARGVTGGFARGDFGLGVDLGVSRRWWDESDTALVGDLVLGAPWGLTMVAGASTGGKDATTFFVSVGIDFARLTVHRHSGLNWFPNPMSSPRRE